MRPRVKIANRNPWYDKMLFFRLSLFTIHYFLAHYSLFIIKKGHYSLIIIPHLDPQKTATRGKGGHSGHCAGAIIFAPPTLETAIAHAPYIKTNSLLLQLSCIRTSTHSFGKRITINFANGILGMDVDHHQ